MSFVNPVRYFPQKATYWVKLSGDGFGSESGWQLPQLISCRWESIIEEQLSSFYSPSGEIEIARSVVFTPNKLYTGNYLYLGASSSSLPTSVLGAFVIRSIGEIIGVRGDYTEFSSYL